MKDQFSANLLTKLDDGLSRAEARENIFTEIAANPGNKSARLLLAKLYYLDNLLEFSVRELIELRRRFPSASLDSLIKSFGPLAEQYQASADSKVEKGETTHGELDFDFSIFEDDN